MNELQIIRGQLTAERDRALEVSVACSRSAADDAAPSTGDAPNGNSFRQQCVAYLVFVLTRFDERDQMLLEVARGQFTDVVARPGTGREVLTKLEAAMVATGMPAQRLWQGFSTSVEGPWRDRRNAIEAQQVSTLSIPDWRAVSFIDADSIVAERTLYASVRAAGAK